MVTKYHILRPLKKTFVQLSFDIQFETTNWNLWKTLFEHRKNFCNWRLKVFIHFETFEKKTFVQLSFDIHFDTSTWSFGKTIFILNSISWPIDIDNPKDPILRMKNIVLNMVLGFFCTIVLEFPKVPGGGVWHLFDQYVCFTHVSYVLKHY